MYQASQLPSSFSKIDTTLDMDTKLSLTYLKKSINNQNKNTKEINHKTYCSPNIDSLRTSSRTDVKKFNTHGNTDITLNIQIQGLKNGNISRTIPIFVESKLRIAELEAILKDKIGFQLKSCDLYYDNQKLEKNYSIADLDIGQGDLLQLKFFDVKNTTTNFENKRHYKKIRKAIGVNNEYINSEKLPRYDKSEYYTKPSYIEMCRMSESELSCVKNFVIGNKFGEVKFWGNADLRNLNLEKIVRIEHKCIEIYPTSHYNPRQIPQIGLGQNMPATQMFRNFSKDKKYDNISKQTYINKVKNWVSQLQNAHYVDFCFEQKELIIKVDHFSVKD